MIDPYRDDPLEESDGEGRRDPAVVPSLSSEQMPFTAGIGVASYVGRTEEPEPDNSADTEADNDQDSHTSPPDNDGETIPRDEVVDQVGG
jgi:hypothetical protein